MTSPKPPLYADLTKTLADIVSAHQAVVEGIATAAEKHAAKRQAEYHKMESERKLKDGIKA